MAGFLAFCLLAILLMGFIVTSIFIGDLHIFDQVASYVDAIIFYLGQAIDIVWIFVPKRITILCMTFTIGANVFRWGYKFVMWMLHKIPFAHIE